MLQVRENTISLRKLSGCSALLRTLKLIQRYLHNLHMKVVHLTSINRQILYVTY